MVEVFKTNVEDTFVAKKIVNLIHAKFSGFTANFDLEDCDNILRIKCDDRVIEAGGIVQLVKEQGLYAEILQDTIGAGHHFQKAMSEAIVVS